MIVKKKYFWICILIITYPLIIFPIDKGYFLDNKHRKKITVESIKNVDVFCKLSTCSAKNLVIAKFSEKLKSFDIGDFDISPASSFCLKHLGVPGAIYDMKKNQIAICEFDDGSFFLTWDLIRIMSRELNE